MNEKQLALSILASPTFAAISEKVDMQRVSALLKNGVTSEDLAMLALLTDSVRAHELDAAKVASIIKRIIEVE